MRHQLTIAPLGETFEVGEGETILEACLKQGIYVPYACGHGRCGTCKVDVVDGEIDHGHASAFALMDFERQDGKALACCATLRGDVTVLAEVEEDEDAQNNPLRELTGRVTSVRDLSPTVRGIWLEVAKDFAFQAGQYIDLHVPGVSGARAFSIANSPSERGIIELHVRLVEGGAATTYLHHTLAVGDELRLKGPMGRFFVRSSRAQPRIFVAGGSGLSSMKSMVLERIENRCTVPVVLIHGARNEKELYDRELFDGLAKAHSHFRYVPVVGFAHEAMDGLFDGKYAGNSAYLCGPPAMVEACIRALMKGRLFEKDIFTERFVTQADGAEALAKSPIFKRI